MNIESRNVARSEIEAILAEAQYGPIFCSFCHKPVGEVAGHVLSVVQKPTGQIERVLATCDDCGEVFAVFQEVLAEGMLGILDTLLPNDDEIVI